MAALILRILLIVALFPAIVYFVMSLQPAALLLVGVLFYFANEPFRIVINMVFILLSRGVVTIISGLTGRRN